MILNETAYKILPYWTLACAGYCLGCYVYTGDEWFALLAIVNLVVFFVWAVFTQELEGE